jgi:hypothetical protein
MASGGKINLPSFMETGSEIQIIPRILSEKFERL